MTCKSINNDSGISEVIGVILITAIVVAASAIAYATVNVYELEQAPENFAFYVHF